jgi:hypothetical protein
MILMQLVTHHDDHLRLQSILLVARLCTETRSAKMMMKNQLISRIMIDGNDNPYNREESFQKLYMVYQLAMSDINIKPIYKETLYLIDSFIDHEFKDRNPRVVTF